MDVGKYKAVTKPLAVDFEGEIINLTYRPNVYTLGFTRRLAEAQAAQNMAEVAQYFVDFLAGWDLMEGDSPIPLTREGVETVPLDILSAIDDQVAKTMLPSEEEKRGSSEPSDSQPQASTKTSSGTQSTDPISSNGSETSASPTVSESVPSS